MKGRKVYYIESVVIILSLEHQHMTDMNDCLILHHSDRDGLTTTYLQADC